MFTDQVAAGIFDADGCLHACLRKEHPNTLQQQAIVAMTHRPAVEQFLERYGGSLTDHQPSRENRRRMYVWRAGSGDLENFLRQILPYLTVKREQAEQMIALRYVKGRAERERLITGIADGKHVTFPPLAP